MEVTNKLKNRDLYLNKLIAFQDKELVKIITGIRRCGKSSLLKLMMQYLKNKGIDDNRILFINFESMEFRNMNVNDFYNYVKNNIYKEGKTYLFFDEVQHIDKWEDAINSFRVDFDCDIYITGSNAYLLSSEYSTYLSGRCIEIKMLPLSFSEFLYFNDYEIKERNNLLGVPVKVVTKNNEYYDLKELFNVYLHIGGMPGISDIGFEQEKAFMLLEGIYSTVVTRDIFEREKIRNRRQITDLVLLKKIILFLADNIGNNVSLNSIGNVLYNEGLIDKEKGKPSTHTIQSYVEALLESYFFYDIKRFDIKGKEYLRTLGKYYIVDIGLRNYLLGLRNRDNGHIIENIVYFELLKRGFDVAIGKINTNEIDFIATKINEKIYIQVTESMNDEKVRERELTPLRKVNDNFEKIVLTLENGLENCYEGIKIINLIEWLIR